MPYMTFKQKVAMMVAKGMPEAEARGIAAKQAYAKYGKKAVQAHAQAGTSMRNVKPLKKHRKAKRRSGY